MVTKGAKAKDSEVAKRMEVLERELEQARKALREAEDALTWESGVNGAMAELSEAFISAKALDEIVCLVLKHAQRLTGSPLGCVGYVDPRNGHLVPACATVDVRDLCQVAGKSTVFDRFAGLWGWVRENRRSLITNSPADDPRSGGTPAGHLPLRRLLSAPAMVGDTLVGQVALANSVRDYDDRDLKLVERLAAIYAIAVQRQRAEDALRESEARFRETVTNSLDFMFHQDLDLRFTWVVNSPQPVQREQIVGKTDFDFFSRDEAESLRTIKRRILETGVEERYETRLVIGGELRHYDAFVRPRRDQEGRIIGIAGYARDITERKRVEDALRESEGRFRHLAENAHDVIVRYRLGPKPTLVYISPAVTRVTGYTPEECYSNSDIGLSVVSPEDLQRLRGLFSTGIPTAPVTVKSRHKDGRLLWVETNYAPVYEGGRLVAFDAIARDVTDRRRAETQVLFQASILDQVRNAVVVTDPEGRIVYWNRHAETLYQWKAEDVMGRLFFEVMVPPAAHRAAPQIIESLANTDHWEGEFTFQRKDGTTFPAYVVEAAIRDDQGHTVGFAGVSIDLTERKQMEERLLRAHRLETAGQIAGQVAHDFNNLLGPLVAYPELIRMQLPADHAAVGFCDEMLNAVQRMVDINTDMLALSRRGVFDQQPVDLNLLTLEALGVLEGVPPELRVELDLTPDPLPASGSAAQILRVISNLLINAREAMADEGVLTVRTENVYLDRPLGRYNQVEVGEYVKLTIADTGSGIPEEIRGKIFDAFFTTKRKARRRGCGLGLSVVQALVEDHKGYIDLESDVGKGTTFYVYLPIHREPAAQRAASRTFPGGVETILVVDDDSVQGEVLKHLLETLGYQVTVLSGGEEAVDYLRGRPVDLLILDMIMPNGIDGAETYRRVLEVRPGQRAIMVSGFAETERVRAAQALGAGPYYRKPLTLETLAEAVRGELERAAIPGTGCALSPGVPSGAVHAPG